ncbi:MAG: PqqD family protein [Chlorobiaceae bacterium]|nr:PqqD family protein [Chlorobiaceae bacterium]
MSVSLETIYVQSEDVVSRIIEDELIIVPLVSGIGESDDDLYTLNETGRAIWSRLDGAKSLNQIAEELLEEFETEAETVQKDLLGLVEELVNRKLVMVR